jgi:alpha-glucosidase (family GH31 glycosyl hydrolase)
MPAEDFVSPPFIKLLRYAMRRTMSLFSISFFVSAIFFLSGSNLAAQCKQEGSSVVCRDARFQFLSPTSIRMEFAPGSDFLDAPTVVVQKREFKPVQIEVWADKEWLVVKTSKLFLRYRVNSGRFTKDNLSLTFKGEKKPFWTPADSDRTNLGGISTSLDGLRKDRMPGGERGILSRSGITVLDDSRSPAWDPSTEWIAPRRQVGNQDWFFFYYGSDYAQMLKWYMELCGPIPMIPRYTLGAWITDLNYEYLPGTKVVDNFKYTDKDVMKIVDRFRSEGIPLDVLVLDFAWHKFGWKGGYDWSPIFPQPKEFLDWAHKSGLKISLNDHPGYGKESVLSDEDSHAAAVRTELRLPAPEKATYNLDLATGWKFKTDPSDVGMKEKWFAMDKKIDDWATIQAGKPWEEQGYPGYDGVAWYRQTISPPVNMPFGNLYLVFGGVDDEYDLYINDSLITHFGSKGNSMYNSASSTEVSGLIRRGENNVIALRVNDWGGDGGLTFAPWTIANKPPAKGIRFNLANKMHAQAFMDILHNPLIDQGVDFWWVDGGSGAVDMPGLNPQLWTNRVFYDFTQDHTKKRGFIFSRYGGLGSHKYPAFFTGDTYSQWEVLAYQVPYTAKGGNVLTPYITHDIGGFIGPNTSFDLYARWVQFGVFSPFLRLHSAHENPEEGNVRMPWTYGDKGIALAKKFFNLRYNLIPYIYTYCREATDHALPIVRPLYLEYPSVSKAYNYPGEYMFGKEFLVAPIADSAAEKEVYLPPGEWIDYFTGQKYAGDKTIREKYPLDRMPLFVKAGSIIPMQPNMAYSDQKPLETMVVDVYASDKGSFSLYEDDGNSLEYKTGKSAWTPLAFTKAGGKTEVSVGPTKGAYTGQPATRAYEVRVHGVTKPGSVTVNNKKVEMGTGKEAWSWDKDKSVVTVTVEARKLRETVKVVLQ